MDANTSVVEKIRKLLALADGNQNEHEREVAMQFAMDLLAKHNLTLSHLENDMSHLSTMEVDGDFRLDPWVRIVLKAACKLYYTEVYISGRYDYLSWRKVNVPVFVGTAENIAVTMEVATWLMNSIRKESNRAYRDEYERRSFRMGAADRIFERAIEMMEAEKKTSTSRAGTSLMVIRNQLERANQKHLSKIQLHPFKSRGSYVERDAYTDGEAYGNRVPLESQRNTARVPERLPQPV